MNESTKQRLGTLLYCIGVALALGALYLVSFNAGVKHGRRLERIELGLERP